MLTRTTLILITLCARYRQNSSKIFWKQLAGNMILLNKEATLYKYVSQKVYTFSPDEFNG
jgi:hypothetical protein